MFVKNFFNKSTIVSLKEILKLKTEDFNKIKSNINGETETQKLF